MTAIDTILIEKRLLALFEFEEGESAIETQVDALKKTLKSCGAVIAGSAIMQSILDVVWQGSDIDIWLPIANNDSPMDSFCKAAAILKCIPSSYNIPKIIKMCPRHTHVGFMEIEEYKRLSKYVTYIVTARKIGNWKKAIQIIFVKTQIAEVISSFDIIASQIWYNGGEFHQILPGNYRDDDQPKSEQITNNTNNTSNTSTNVDSRQPIYQLFNSEIKMSKIALELQTPFEWIRTINRIEKYKTRFAKAIDDDQKILIVNSIIAQINIQQQLTTTHLTENSLSVMSDYLQNFKTVWKDNENCTAQGITVIWVRRNGGVSDVLEFKIQGSAYIDYTAEPPRPPEPPEPLQHPQDPRNVVQEEKKAWHTDTYKQVGNDTSISGENQTNLEKIKNCFDFCAYDYEDIEKYLDQDNNDNIVIFDPSGEKPICYTRQRLTDLRNTATTVFYPCKHKYNLSSVIKDKTVVRIHCEDYNVVVPITDVDKAIGEKNLKIFRIYETNTEFDFTASANTAYNVHERALLSGDHCQEGTNKKLYRLEDGSMFNGAGGGGKKTFNYNGSKYELLHGKRGGKYIFIGEKKIYISEKDDLMSQIQNARSRKANTIQAKRKAKK